VITLWLQPPPPVDNHWVLHVAASPHDVDDALREVCVHKHARPFGDADFPAFLAGTGNPAEPPAWMTVVETELTRRGHRVRWCDPGCPAHSRPSEVFSRITDRRLSAPAPRPGPSTTN
jgi:hypothetical protein